MTLLQELFALMEASKPKKPKTVQLASDERAGAKALNDALRRTKSTGHYAAKTDYDRAKEKKKVRGELHFHD